MPRPITPEDLLAIELAGEPQLSPDGRKLAYVVARIDKEQNETRHQIFLMDAMPGARAAAFTSGGKSDRNPRWSPDGTRLAFLSNRSGKNQIWVISALGGEAWQLTRFKEGVSGPPLWSPDGRSIAFTAGVEESGPQLEGEKEEEPDLYTKHTKGVKRINRIFYKLDGVGFLDPGKHEQLFLIPVEEGQPEARQLTRGPWNHRSPAWSPDGKAIAFIANRREEDDYTPHLSDIYVLDLERPDAEPVRITPEGGYGFSDLAWSPDGAQIAALGDDNRYGAYTSTRLYLMGRDGSGFRLLTGGWDRTFGPATIYDMPAPGGGRLRWTPDGAALVCLGSDRGRQQVYAIDAESGSVTALTGGDHCVTGWSYDGACRKLAVAVTRPDVVSDLFLVEGPDLLRLTEVNAALMAELALAPVEHFTFRTADGSNAFLQAHGTAGPEETDGWVMRPPGLAEGERCPAILEIHGGPMGMYGWTFFMEFQCLAAAGYAVIYTNPRGSQGYGQHFCACIQCDWGNLDYLDVMAGLEAALARFPWIDPDRLGVAGGSYGGYMTNHILGHTDRFKAAITMRSVVNEVSMVGTSDFGFLDLKSYPSAPWDEDTSFYRRVSPLSFVERIRTPLLIEHQEEDLRCPVGQAEELYTALKYLRRTVEMVRYPESSHGMSRTGKPWLRVHRLKTILDWFGRYIER
ncbi:MAG: prolyl oligopeptidase family serine peptidase [Bacillota bacterium]